VRRRGNAVRGQQARRPTNTIVGRRRASSAVPPRLPVFRSAPRRKGKRRHPRSVGRLSFTQVQRRCWLFIAPWILLAVRYKPTPSRLLDGRPVRPVDGKGPRYCWRPRRAGEPRTPYSLQHRPTNARPLHLLYRDCWIPSAANRSRLTSTIHHQNWQLIEAYQAGTGSSGCRLRRCLDARSVGLPVLARGSRRPRGPRTAMPPAQLHNAAVRLSLPAYVRTSISPNEVRRTGERAPVRMEASARQRYRMEVHCRIRAQSPKIIHANAQKEINGDTKKKSVRGARIQHWDCLWLFFLGGERERSFLIVSAGILHERQYSLTL